MGPGERGEDHVWDRSGQASHGGLFLLVLCKGVCRCAGGALV